MGHRLVLYMQYFNPEPVYKGEVFVRRLRDLGFDVSVVTGIPNYPIGKFYDGYRFKFWQTDNLFDFKVTRLALVPTRSKNPAIRSINYLTFGLACCFHLIANFRSFDAIYVYHPPGLLAAPIMWLSNLMRKASILDVHDLWPESLNAVSLVRRESKIYAVVGWAMTIAYSRADVIFVQSPGIKSNLISKGVNPTKIHCVFQWASEQEDSALERLFFSEDSRAPLRVLYAGNIGLAQDLRVVLGAAEKIIRDFPNLNIEFTIMGDGLERDKLIALSQERGLTNVKFAPRVCQGSITEILQTYDILLVHLKNDPLFEVTIPAKIQAYMAAGMPILCGVRGDAWHLVKRAGCGFYFSPGDSNSLVQILEEVAGKSRYELFNIGLSGRHFYHRNLTMGHGIEKMADVIFSLGPNYGG